MRGRGLITGLLTLAGSAFAHGVVPQTLDVFGRPGSTTQALVGTTFGGLLTQDQGASFQWVCEEAVGLAAGQRASWAWTSQGTLLAASFAGLFVSRDEGCNWTPVDTFAASGAAVIVEAGGVLYATTGRYGVTNGLFVSRDDAHTFTPLGLASTTEFYSSVKVAPSRVERLYVGAWFFDPKSDAVLVSDDSGGSFRRVNVSQATPVPGALTVLAVHPLKSDLVLAAVVEDARTPRSWLLRSTDATNFSVVLESSVPITHAAFSDDGAQLWVAAGDSFYGSADEGLTLSVLPSPTRSSCVSVSTGVAWFCGKEEVDGFGIARSNQDSRLRPWLTWNQLSGPPSCPADSGVSLKCGPIWPILQEQLLGSADAGTSVDGGTEGPRRGACGCDGAALGPWWLSFLGWAAWAFRVRRSR